MYILVNNGYLVCTPTHAKWKQSTRLQRASIPPNPDQWTTMIVLRNGRTT